MTIGQEIYLKPIGNAARYSNELKTDIITKIGNKFFYTQHNGRFFIETMQQDCGEYSARYVAYYSKRDYYEYMEKHELYDSIKKFFSGYGNIDLPLESLRRIAIIIKENKKL